MPDLPIRIQDRYSFEKILLTEMCWNQFEAKTKGYTRQLNN